MSFASLKAKFKVDLGMYASKTRPSNTNPGQANPSAMAEPRPAEIVTCYSKPQPAQSLATRSGNSM